MAAPPGYNAGATMLNPSSSAASAPIQAMSGGALGQRKVSLFGVEREIQNPANITDEIQFDATYSAFIRDLNLAGMPFDKKKRVLQAIYDSNCAADENIARSGACEPMREMLGSLALNLLAVIADKKPIVPVSKVSGNMIEVSVRFPIGLLQINLGAEGSEAGVEGSNTRSVVSSISSGSSSSSNSSSSNNSNNSSSEASSTNEDEEAALWPKQIINSGKKIIDYKAELERLNSFLSTIKSDRNAETDANIKQRLETLIPIIENAITSKERLIQSEEKYKNRVSAISENYKKLNAVKTPNEGRQIKGEIAPKREELRQLDEQMAQEEQSYSVIQQQIHDTLSQIISLKTGRPANTESVASSESSVSDLIGELEAAFRSASTQPAVAAARAAAANAVSTGGRRITRKLRRI